MNKVVCGCCAARLLHRGCCIWCEQVLQGLALAFHLVGELCDQCFQAADLSYGGNASCGLHGISLLGERKFTAKRTSRKDLALRECLPEGLGDLNGVKVAENFLTLVPLGILFRATTVVPARRCDLDLEIPSFINTRQESSPIRIFPESFSDCHILDLVTRNNLF